jgi:hypothetical protein
VSLWSPSQGDVIEASTQDSRTTMTVSIQPASVEPSYMFLQFKKAKFLGIHTGMYWLDRVDRLLGTDVTFTWLRDT